jgi:hypothetical protein
MHSACGSHGDATGPAPGHPTEHCRFHNDVMRPAASCRSSDQKTRTKYKYNLQCDADGDNENQSEFYKTLALRVLLCDSVMYYENKKT